MLSVLLNLPKKAGYVSLEKARKKGLKLKAGDKIWADIYGKSIMLVQIGKEPLSDGFNILGAHIDSPRLDLKQNPLYETNDFVLLDTHYYGGTRIIQWVTLPLALHGVIAKKDGSLVEVSVGDKPEDPVFCVTDLLPHLGDEQMKKTGNLVVEGENLDILVGSQPCTTTEAEAEVAGEKKNKSYEDELKVLSQKEPVKSHLLSLLFDTYGVEEEDFLSAELEVVPAGRARECGFDRSLILGYGQDDRVCAYTSAYCSA